jgi:cytochrome c peroxidase
VLHYNAARGDLVGGAFWDMRATGLRLNSPLAEQAEGPPLDPNEMGMIDAACVVYRMSDRPYRPMAERPWGAQAFAIRWPSDVKTVCERPGPAPNSEPQLNPFSSKYDYVIAGKAQLTPDENIGYALFRSKATHCNECHRDGGPGEEPLFTDFTASNLGLPPNPDIPFYEENAPDHFGFTANVLGLNFLDLGVGGFLDNRQNPDRQWEPGAKSFIGKYKTPTLRHVDKRPRPDFVKAYMHNGYLKSLQEVVHFYNTRDALPRCKAGDPGEKVSCWPALEHPETMNRKQLGNLKLTRQQGNQIVAFLKTLTDGYVLPPASPLAPALPK